MSLWHFILAVFNLFCLFPALKNKFLVGQYDCDNFAIKRYCYPSGKTLGFYDTVKYSGKHNHCRERDWRMQEVWETLALTPHRNYTSALGYK